MESLLLFHLDLHQTKQAYTLTFIKLLKLLKKSEEISTASDLFWFL